VGRGVTNPNLISRVRSLRQAGGISQQDLARQVGLSRQALGAIESGQYVPSTAVALRLARALGCRVEDVFRLADADPGIPINLVASPPGDARRLAVVNVRGRWVGYPLTAGREIQEGFVSANSVRDEWTAAGRVRLLGPPEDVGRSALLLGCDPSLGILRAHLNQRPADGQLLWLSMASQPALDAVARGEAHLAGSHLRDAASGEYNLPQAQRALGAFGGLVVAFARWEQGFVLTSGNPLAIRTVADLARPGVRLVNRELGSGSRTLLDELLTEAGVPVGVLAGYDHVAASHLAVARSVAEGAADVGIGLEAVARVYGLDFVPLTAVQFDLIVPRDQLDHPTVALVLDHLQSRALRADLRALPGYDVEALGTVVADLPRSVA
jgi:putative molybdopterin biosynthesis protein